MYSQLNCGSIHDATAAMRERWIYFPTREVICDYLKKSKIIAYRSNVILGYKIFSKTRGIQLFELFL